MQALGKRVQQGLARSRCSHLRVRRHAGQEVGNSFGHARRGRWLDITVDGADEVDPRLDLIKGLGGALVREKIVAASSRRLVIVVGQEKLVADLGEHGMLPVEVVPFGLNPCRRRLAALGFIRATIRRDGRRS